MSPLLIIGVAFVGLGVILAFARRSQQRRLLAIKRTQTWTARDLADLATSVGQELGETGHFRQTAEVKGLIECDSPLVSEIAAEPCVHYSSTVTREYEETYYDTDPQTKRREQKTRRGSETVASNSRTVPFWVADATGRILVDPEGASIHSEQVVDRFEAGDANPNLARLSGARTDRSASGQLLAANSAQRTLGYRFRERTVPVGSRIYVLGEATDASGHLTVQRPSQKSHDFIVSLRSEEEILQSAASAVRWLSIAIYGCLALGGIMIVAHML